ncbi:MAG: CD225/dispanin family protein [Rikenellaceae bacterium]|nr:CD225/dispanin family protein [Rikenellaceae bacterium]MDE7355993.1 CD225/dispanin family protein [Rikenellaceae bacterium]
MQTITIGRNPQDNNVAIDDNSVSERHCSITLHDNGCYIIEDHNSASGTFVNDVRISGIVPLNPMTDTLKVGNINLQWQSYFNRTEPSQPCPQQTPSPYGQPSQHTQQPSGQNSIANKPDSYMVGAILSTMLCCLPLGVVAIVQANKVDTLWATGDYAGAEAAAKSARKLTWWSVGLAGGIVALYLLSIMTVGLFSMIENL